MNVRNNWSWWNDTMFMKDFMTQVATNYNSTIVLYGMKQTSGFGYLRSVFVKPYGIDQVGLNWYDNATYDLCGLYTRKDHSPVIRQLSPNQGSVTNDLMWLNRMDWDVVSTASRKRLSTKMVGKEDFTVRFFLRDKTTKKISQPSRARIVLSQRHRHAPFKYEVKG
jgi:hypothetical protein